MAGRHAFFAPSSAHRVATCPASLLQTKDLPDTPSFEAVEGTVAHAIHEEVLTRGVFATEFVGRRPQDFIPRDDLSDAEWALLEGFTVSQEMAHYVQESADWCDALPGRHFIEQRLSISRWTPLPDQFGTSDHTALDFAERTIFVSDLKFGKGVKVFAERNYQLVLYALGVLDEFSIFGEIDKVFICVSQPRLDHRDVWETTPAELYEIGAYLRERFTLALKPDAPFGPEKHACQFCKLKPTCPALYQRTLELVHGMFDDLDAEIVAPNTDGDWPISTPDTRGLTSEQVATLIDHADLVSDFIQSAKDHAMHLLLHSVDVPRWKVVEGRSHRQWANVPEARKFCEARAIDFYKPPSPISPAEAESQMPASEKRKLAPLVHKPKGKPTLAPETDKRPAFTPATVEGMFDDLTGSEDL